MGRKKKESQLAVAELTLPDAVFLRDLLRLINKFQDDVTFFVKYDGIKISEFDPAKIAMADYWIPKEAFDEYYVHKCGRFMINVPQTLKIAFTRVTKEDQVKISVDGKNEVAEFVLQNRVRSNGSKKRKLPIIDEDVEEPPTPVVDFTSTYLLVAKEFIKDLQDLQKAGFSLAKFISDEEGNLYLKGSEDVAEFANEYRRGCDIILEHEVLSESQASYRMSYLLDNAFPKELLALTELVEISWATDMPLRVKMKPNRPAELTHWIAPAIEV